MVLHANHDDFFSAMQGVMVMHRKPSGLLCLDTASVVVAPSLQKPLFGLCCRHHCCFLTAHMNQVMQIFIVQLLSNAAFGPILHKLQRIILTISFFLLARWNCSLFFSSINNYYFIIYESMYIPSNYFSIMFCSYCLAWWCFSYVFNMWNAWTGFGMVPSSPACCPVVASFPQLIIL
jgi:hypothetical protein